MDEPGGGSRLAMNYEQKMGGRTNQRDMRQSVKKKERYAEAPHYIPTVSLHLHQRVRHRAPAVHVQPSLRAANVFPSRHRSGTGKSTHPKQRQKHLRNPKPPLHAPRPLIPPLHHHLPHKREQTSQPPPRSRDGTEAATDEEGDVPVRVDAQEDGDGGVEDGSAAGL